MKLPSKVLLQNNFGECEVVSVITITNGWQRFAFDAETCQKQSYWCVSVEPPD